MEQFTKKAASALKLAAKAADGEAIAISVPSTFFWDFWKRGREPQPRF